jgi:transposase-like protein
LKITSGLNPARPLVETFKCVADDAFKHTDLAIAEFHYRRMIYAPTREAVARARIAFTRKWQLRCKAVSASFAEAGDELFTFIVFPISQWKALASPMRWSGSTRSSAGGPKPRLRSRAKKRCCFCSSDSCAAVESRCAAWSAGKT